MVVFSLFRGLDHWWLVLLRSFGQPFAKFHKRPLSNQDSAIKPRRVVPLSDHINPQFRSSDAFGLNIKRATTGFASDTPPDPPSGRAASPTGRAVLAMERERKWRARSAEFLRLAAQMETAERLR